MSEYTRIKNHLAASHWTWNFSELSTLLLTKTFHFQNTWNNIPGVYKQTAACIFQDNKSSEKFLVTWVLSAAKWFFIWVYFDIRVPKISCHISGSQIIFDPSVFWNESSEKFLVTRVTAKWFLNLSVFWHGCSGKLLVTWVAAKLVWHESLGPNIPRECPWGQHSKVNIARVNIAREWSRSNSTLP